MLADSVVWLFVARGIQGLATGLALSAASAALLDLHPDRDPVAVGLANGVASTIGMGTGVLVSAAIVQYLPAPRVLPYVLLVILFLVALAAAWRLREPVEVAPGARFRLTPQRPYVPPVARRPFLLAALAVLSSWSIGGLFLSLGPELSAIVYSSDSHLVTGLGIFMLALLGRRRPARSSAAAAPWAAPPTARWPWPPGWALIVAASAADSAVLFTLGAIVTGAGFGVAFLGGLRSLSAAIPPEHRAATMSAFYVVAYGSLSIPAVIAGLLVEPLGVQETFEIFGTAIILVALLVPARPGASARGRPSGPVLLHPAELTALRWSGGRGRRWRRCEPRRSSCPVSPPEACPGGGAGPAFAAVGGLDRDPLARHGGGVDGGVPDRLDPGEDLADRAALPW